MTSRILLVEDDELVRDAVTLVLEASGYVVTGVADGADAIAEAVGGDHDLMVLDLMLPSIDGLDVCRAVRRTSRLPILMLTARAESDDVISGLRLGADDYVTKPFEPSVLVARVGAVLRRTSDDVVHGGALDAPGSLLIGRDLRLDTAARRTFRGDQEILLTVTEFRLLAELMANRGRTVAREVLLERVWGYDYLGDTRLVDLAAARLNQRLGDPPHPPPYVVTVSGTGYRFERA